MKRKPMDSNTWMANARNCAKAEVLRRFGELGLTTIMFYDDTFRDHLHELHTCGTTTKKVRSEAGT